MLKNTFIGCAQKIGKTAGKPVIKIVNYKKEKLVKYHL